METPRSTGTLMPGVRRVVRAECRPNRIARFAAPRCIAISLGCLTVAIACGSPCAAATVDRGETPQKAVVSAPSRAESLRPLRDLAPGFGYAPVAAFPDGSPTADSIARGVPSGALGTSAASTTAPTLLGTFSGIAGAVLGASPPDPMGAVGKTQYVQVVNLSFAVYDKATTNLLAGPLSLQTLWASYTGTNAGNGCSTA